MRHFISFYHVDYTLRWKYFGCVKIKYITGNFTYFCFTKRGYRNLNYMCDKPDLSDTHGTLHSHWYILFSRAMEHITKWIYIGPLGKLPLFQRTEKMQDILRDCNGLTVYVPWSFILHVVMILGGRDSGRGQVRMEWAPMLPEQGEEAGSLGPRKQASPDMAPVGDLGNSQPPVL